jgi:hypothetical protein
MYRANHGQWNTVWGNKDNGPRSGRSLDLRALIDPEAQREMAKVLISGFLEATIHQKREYLPMFRDHRTAGEWLPNTMYTTKFQENGYHALTAFDRDIDLTTGAAGAIVIQGEHLSAWKEAAVPFRGRGNDTQNHNAVTIGWNNRFPVGTEDEGKEGESASGPNQGDGQSSAQRQDEPKGPPAPPASYSVTVPPAALSAWNVGENSAVYVSLAATTTRPGPRQRPEDPDKKKEEEEKAANEKKPAPKPPARPRPKKDEEPDMTPIDLTVELVDAAGRVARLPLSQFGIARKPLETRIYRREGRDEQRFSNIYELIPQTFVMPVADFTRAVPDFDPRQLSTIRLLFDRTEAGTVVIEHIGLSTPTDPAFLAAAIR